jgi:hypothetical protein
MRRAEQLLAATGIFAVVHAAWGLNGVPECGEAEAPQCNGECPAGTRCTQILNESASFLRIIEEVGAQGPQAGHVPEEPGCACLEVPCGGVPLEDGQACCNGQVINASDECFCSDEPNFSACCFREGEFQGNSSVIDVQLAMYTYNLPLDCCAGTTCGGRCVGAECAASDCCVCEEFPDDQVGPPPACAAADSDLGCLVACFFSPEGVGFFSIPEVGLGNQSGVRIEDGTCGEAGCIPPTAEAPAASSAGLAVSIACLVAIGVLALVRRRREASRSG